MGSPAKVYEFGEFRLDATERLLLRDGSVVPLTPKAFDTLLMLVENSGHVLTRAQLLEAVWRDSFVEENTLTQNIAALRKALGEGQNGDQYIETVPKLGYRFVREVREVDKRTGDRAVIEAQETDEHAGNRAKKYRGLSIVALVLVSIGIVTAVLLILNPSKPAEPGGSIKSFAVLPFKNLSAEATDEYLGVGLADVLTTRLGKFNRIIVRPTNAVYQYRGIGQDPVAAGRDLRVDAVLDGSIQRSGDRVRVSLQLVSVPASKTIWSETFDEKFTDILILQDQVANKVAGAIELELTAGEKERLATRPTESADAYQAYLKGRYFWNKSTEEGMNRGIQHFEEAIRIDPNFALAYVGLADCYNRLGSDGAVLGGLLPREVYPKAKSAALSALEIDEGLAEAYASLAHVKWNYERDWVGAESDLKRSIERDPNFAQARHLYAILLAQLGRIDEATAEIRRAQELDPVSVAISTSLGWVFYWGRQYDQAIEQCRKALELDPNFGRAYWIAGLAYRKKGMHQEAIAELQKAAAVSGDRPAVKAALAQTYAAAGKRAEARKLLNELEELSKQRYFSPYLMAAIYAELGQRDRAFALLEKAWVEHAIPMIQIKLDPIFDSLHSDPRFKELLHRLGIAD